METFFLGVAAAQHSFTISDVFDFGDESVPVTYPGQMGSPTSRKRVYEPPLLDL